MNIGGGEAADQLVRMMLSGTEVTVRLSGSALRNLLALTMALAKNNKTVSGKISLGKMLRETRDLRQFPMTPEQYRQFVKLAKRQKILFSAIRDQDDRGRLVDVILPVTELDRANMVFERITYASPARQEAPRRLRQERERQEDTPSKKDSPSARDSPDIEISSSSPREDKVSTMTSDRPSVEGRLKTFRAQLEQRKESVPSKSRGRKTAKTK